MEISKKKLLAIMLVLTTFLAMFAVFGPIAVSTNYIDVDDYCWIEGVLHSDTYALYPYAEESLDIGFSKYGEMIGYNEDTEIGLGLQYPGYESAADPDLAPDGTYDQTIDTSVDPFCNEYIDPDWWMNGWFIDIKYRTPAGVYREIWAMAMFSDGQQYGGDWIVMPSVAPTSLARPLWQEYPPYAHPDSTKYVEAGLDMPEQGGRKTNGYCVTDPIEIIYNGPRRFVALCKTTISDTGGGADLVAIYFTFIFNKAEKNVIILKDVKRLYTKQPMNIQFGNRGEWDLGLAGDTDSYTHWYTDEPVQYWDIDNSGDINCTEVEMSFDFFRKYMLSYKHPKKWWDDVEEAGQLPNEVCNEWTEVLEDFPETWLETQYTCYGRDWHWDKTIKEHSYAVAQVITKAGDYVGALAVWPHPEFWSAANTYFPPERTVAPSGENPSSIALMLAPISRMLQWHKWTVEEDPNEGEPGLDVENRDNIWVKADDIRYPDGTTSEPIIPFLIYEHDFELSASLPEYRIVSVYMLTDCHDADDADADDVGNEEAWSSGLNVIDREIQYQLDEIFDPWDIYDAMHKNTKSWVQFFDRDYLGRAWDGETYYCIQLDDYREIESGELIPSLPVYWASNDWDDYCCDSEKVLVDTGSGYELIYPYWYNWLDPVPNYYSPYYIADYTTGMICFYEWDDDLGYIPWAFPAGTIIKVLWSSEHHATTAEQWDEDDELYPIDGSNFIFPLQHDVMDQYKDLTEVFLIEQPPERLTEGVDYIVHPSTRTLVSNELLYNGSTTQLEGSGYWLANDYVECGSIYVYVNGTLLTYLTKYELYWDPSLPGEYNQYISFLEDIDATDFGGNSGDPFNITATYYYYTRAYIELTDPYYGWYCKELDVKYHIHDYFTCESGYIEEKFHLDLEEGGADSLYVRTIYNLTYPMDFVEKAWIHSEKTLLGGDYVFNRPYNTIYMQDPVADGEWLWVEYEYATYDFIEFFKGNGKKTAFILTYPPDEGTLEVYNTVIIEYILPEDDVLSIEDHCVQVPKQDSYMYDSAGTYVAKTKIVYSGLKEWEILCRETYPKVRGNWIIRESPTGDHFSTCDELILDQAPLDYYDVNYQTSLRYYSDYYWPGQELKIVFKVPSGRYEWATVGETAASVDSLGNTMVVAAFKNKLIEFGLGSLDWQDLLFGPSIPWMIRDISPDTLGRIHLRDDWCYSLTGVGLDRSWPISSSNIISVGGSAVNDVTEYFNDFLQALDGTTVTGTHGRAGIYAVTCWDRDMSTYGFYEFPGAITDRYGYAVIATYKDKNGTIGFIVEGWSGQDTYYAAKWFDEHKYELQHINLHVTDLILKIEYKYSDGDLRCPPVVTILEKLGTISEKPQHDCP